MTPDTVTKRLAQADNHAPNQGGYGNFELSIKRVCAGVYVNTELLFQ